jgi:hypothetical protein
VKGFDIICGIKQPLVGTLDGHPALLCSHQSLLTVSLQHAGVAE